MRMTQLNNADPNSPAGSPSILHRVRNKNNLAQTLLQRKVEEYNKDLKLTLFKIDEERLDMMDFLKKMKLCDSEILTEFAELNKDLRENRPRHIEDMDLPILGDVNLTRQVSQFDLNLKTVVPGKSFKNLQRTRSLLDMRTQPTLAQSQSQNEMNISFQGTKPDVDTSLPKLLHRKSDLHQKFDTDINDIVREFQMTKTFVQDRPKSAILAKDLVILMPKHEFNYDAVTTDVLIQDNGDHQASNKPITFPDLGQFSKQQHNQETYQVVGNVVAEASRTKPDFMRTIMDKKSHKNSKKNIVKKYW